MSDNKALADRLTDYIEGIGAPATLHVSDVMELAELLREAAAALTATPSAQAASLWVQFSDDGENIRFWTNDPERALAESFCPARPLTAFYTTPQPQGDAGGQVSGGGAVQTLWEASDLAAVFKDECRVVPLHVALTAALSPAQARPDGGEVCPHCERITSIRHCQACGADFISKTHPAPAPDVARLVEAAKEVADEHMGLAATTIYHGDDDEVGTRACCGVRSYDPHTPDCPALKLREALAPFTAAQNERK